MKSFLSLLLLSSLLTFESNSQEQRVATCMIDSAGRRSGVYYFDVFATRTNPTSSILVGTSSFFFDFNFAALTAPELSFINPNYTGDGTGSYSPMTAQIIVVGSTPKIGVTITYAGGGAAQPLAPTPGERLFRIGMTVLNQQATANLQWDMVNSAFTTTNSQSVQHLFLGGDNSPLPVQLSTFAATEERGRGIRLRWTTTSEINNYGFNVQRRRNGDAAWTELPNSFVPGNGTTNEPHAYEYLDNSTQQGSWQYRLRQVDLDGAEHFTEPISISALTSVREQAPIEYALKQNYPNPFNPATVIKFSVEKLGRATLEVFNTVGQRVATLFDDVAEPGYLYDTRFDATNLASGTYFFRIQSGSFVQTKKMMLVR